MDVIFSTFLLWSPFFHEMCFQSLHPPPASEHQCNHLPPQVNVFIFCFQLYIIISLLIEFEGTAWFIPGPLGRILGQSWIKVGKWGVDGRVNSSTTVSQHYSAPEDLLPPFTRPLPDESRLQGPFVTPVSTPARALRQHPGAASQWGVQLLLHPALPLPSSSHPAFMQNTPRLWERTAWSFWCFLCRDCPVGA